MMLEVKHEGVVITEELLSGAQGYKCQKSKTVRQLV
jgi:hypothetical protein